jgi:hypothetical protein
MNYFLPIHCGSPDMATKRQFNLNKWLSSVRYFTYYSNKSNVSKSLPKIFILKKYSEQHLAHYLAGLLEGDGYISIAHKNRVILGITFNLKDKPLAEKLISYFGTGFLAKRPSNSIELRFSSKKTLCQIIQLINGKFRTPKIEELHKLID